MVLAAAGSEAAWRDGERAEKKGALSIPENPQLFSGGLQDAQGHWHPGQTQRQRRDARL